MPVYLFLILGMLFILLGIPLRLKRIPPNSFYGFRVDATRRDPEMWYSTNARSGSDMVATGCLLVLLFFIFMLHPVSPLVTAIALAGTLVLGAAATTIRGFSHIRSQERKRQNR